MRVYTRAVPIACLLDNGMNYERLPLVVPVCGSQDNVQLMSNRAHDTDIVRQLSMDALDHKQFAELCFHGVAHDRHEK